jgi:hypothetical protein
MHDFAPHSLFWHIVMTGLPGIHSLVSGENLLKRLTSRTLPEEGLSWQEMRSVTLTIAQVNTAPPLHKPTTMDWIALGVDVWAEDRFKTFVGLRNCVSALQQCSPLVLPLVCNHVIFRVHVCVYGCWGSHRAYLDTSAPFYVIHTSGF